VYPYLKLTATLLRAGFRNRLRLEDSSVLPCRVGFTDWNPQMPTWVSAWIEAEGQRPWPAKTE
jgi:hypothetical protein